MNPQALQDLKEARRRFASTYYFVMQDCGVIEGESDPVKLVEVTDTGSDPTICLYRFVDPSIPAILVSHDTCKQPGDPADWLAFPNTFEGYPVHYYRHEDYLIWLGIKRP